MGYQATNLNFQGVPVSACYVKPMGINVDKVGGTASIGWWGYASRKAAHDDPSNGFHVGTEQVSRANEPELYEAFDEARCAEGSDASEKAAIALMETRRSQESPTGVAAMMVDAEAVLEEGQKPVAALVAAKN